MNVNQIYKQAFVQLILFCGALAAVRFSNGAFLFAMMLFGIFWAMQGNTGRALSIMVMMQFMIIVNPVILPKNSVVFAIGARFGTLMVGLAMAMRGLQSGGRYRLPFGMLVAYLGVAALSSCTGYAPMISYMKLINFFIFLIGLWFGVQGLSQDVRQVQTVRATLLALSAFLILGSIAVLPFPGISTLNAMQMAKAETDVSVRNAIVREMIEGGNLTLFCGITFQSQTLAPLLSCALAWLVCDLLFIEERFRWPHAIMIAGVLPLLYKTRSRVALVCLFVITIVVYFYLPRKIQMNVRMRKWLGSMLAVIAVLGIFAAGYMEFSSNAITRWVRKTNDVEGDKRSLQEAVTSSREGLIEMCMSDFRKNPYWGMGFQVASYTKERVSASRGLVLSSPIEKGVLPIMILGETGVIGFAVFVAFLFCFFAGCARKKLYITLSLMAVLLSLNLGEANFFSPGGPGGVEWWFTIAGGYALDMWLVTTVRRRMMQDLSV